MSSIRWQALRPMFRNRAFWAIVFISGLLLFVTVSNQITQTRFEENVKQAQVAMDSGSLKLANEYIKTAGELGDGPLLDEIEARWNLLSESNRNFSEGSRQLMARDYSSAIESLSMVSPNDALNYIPAQELLEEAEEKVVQVAISDSKQLSNAGNGEAALNAIQSVPDSLATDELRLLELNYREQYVQELFEAREYLTLIETVSEASGKGFDTASFEPYFADAKEAYIDEEISKNSELSTANETSDLFVARAAMRELANLVGEDERIDEEISRLNGVIQKINESKESNSSNSDSQSSSSSSSLDTACSAMKTADLAVASAAQNLYAGSVSNSDIIRLKAAEKGINSTYKATSGGFYSYMLTQAQWVYLLWTSIEYGDGGSAVLAIEYYLDDDEYTRYCN